MGEVTLKIGADVQGALNGTEKLNKSVDELNKDTQAYNQKATQGFNQTGQAATNASQGVSKASQAFKLLGGAVAGAFSVGLILQWGKAIASSTGAGADAMERFNEGSKRAMAALNTALATADFSGLISGLREAWEEGKRYADVLDEIKARQAALGAFKATLATQQAEQKLIARTAENSVEVKMAAIDKIVELEKQKLSETLNLQNTELDEALRASAVRTGISAKDEEQLKARKALVEEWARAYGTIEGTNKLNQDLAKAVELEAELEKKIKVSIDDRGRMNKDLRAYNAAMANLTEEEKRLLALKEVNLTIQDEERDNINKIIEAREGSVKESIDQETSLQRYRTQLLNEIFGAKEKEAKADIERTKSTVEENLASLDKYVKEANEKIYDIELGFGGTQSLDEYEKQIENNLKGFEDIMSENPMFSDENGAQAKAYDEAQKQMADNLAEFERIQQEAWAKMQAFAEEHPIAEALGFDSQETVDAFKSAMGDLVSASQEFMDSQIEAKDERVAALDEQIAKVEETMEKELEFKKEGLANDFDMQREQLIKLQELKDQELKDKAKWVKAQKILNTIMQASDLAMAASKILASEASKGLAGVVIGIGALALLLSTFSSFVGSANEAATAGGLQMKEGGEVKYGLLKGKRHFQGGIPIEAEGGEWFFSRDRTQKYRPLFEAIQKDDEHGMKLFFDRKFIQKMPQQRLNFDIDKSKKLGEIVREMKKGKADITYGNGYIIERIGSYTKKINLN